MRSLYTITITLLLAQIALFSQPLQKSEPGPFVLTNGTIHTITQGEITGDLWIEDGKIKAIGTIDAPSTIQRIDCSGKHIYPGMVDGGTTIGLVEVNAVSLTSDANEIGDLTPHMEALTAVNPNSVLIPVTRVSGVTSALTMPTGGLFPGTASLIHLHGYTPDQMHAGFKGVVLNYPTSGRRSRFDRRSEEDIKKQEEKNLKQLNEAWEQAILYHRMDSSAGNQPKNLNYNPEMERLAQVVRGELPLMVQVNGKKEIVSAIQWVKKNRISRVIFMGVAEGHKVADSLAAHNIPVITGPVIALPARTHDRYDAAYANAGIMQKAGVKVAIRSMESENVRNLPYHAGFAAAYGMDKEEALKAITIVPAEIFGLQEEIGSLEVGKLANVFVCDGDPFETKTQVSHVFIDGWKIPMDSRHIRLYNEFLDRAPGSQK